jgi:hypothetical protein
MRRTKWTREIIIKKLQEWHAAGVPVKSLWRQDEPMTSSASALFGSWRAALQAAGFRSVRRRWSRDLIIKELRECRRNQRKISEKLRSAANSEFGSISQAYAAAGVKSRQKPQPPLVWTQESTLAAVRNRHKSGRTLSTTHREDPVLYAAAKRYFGRWTAALAAAGLTPLAVERLSATQVILRIQERQRAGRPLTNIHLHDPTLARESERHFGSWSKTLLAAGVSITIRCRWSKQLVIERIHARQQRCEDLSKTWTEDKLLFTAATRHFGSWTDAMRAAGFEAIARERWNQRRVLERLQAWACRSGHRNHYTADSKLVAAAIRFFGSYEAALKAAGLEISRRFWTESRVVEKIQDRYIAGAPLAAPALVERSLAVAAKRRFGSWPAAVEAAGLQNKIVFKELPRRWSRELVIQEILAWYRSGRPLTEVHTSCGPLSSAANNWFGSWRAALCAAGLTCGRRIWSKQVVIDEILDRYRNGRSLTSSHPSNVNLVAAAQRHFGSWRKAIAASEVKLRPAKGKGA